MGSEIPAEKWLDQNLNKFSSLTSAVITIIENLLKSSGIPYLAVTGRTKNKEEAIEKIKRKGYENPSVQLTDISGIRVIVYFEADVQKVSELITSAFDIDVQNSLNKDKLLSTNQIGYRSVHFVCTLGAQRESLPEFKKLSGLKFEFQLRTVLQHAWAELAHDRNYKFSGKLPPEIERKLNLYAGMLEIADKGFDEISNQINSYISSLHEKSSKGDLSSEINSISLVQFVEEWCKENHFKIEVTSFKDNCAELVEELKEFEITTLESLSKIIPENYVINAKKLNYSTTIFGLVRDWMLISDWRKFLEKVTFSWVMSNGEMMNAYFNNEEFAEFCKSFRWEEQY